MISNSWFFYTLFLYKNYTKKKKNILASLCKSIEPENNYIKKINNIISEWFTSQLKKIKYAKKKERRRKKDILMFYI